MTRTEVLRHSRVFQDLVCLLILFVSLSSRWAYAQRNASSIAIPAAWAASFSTDGGLPNIATGYATFTRDGQTPLPTGQAILGFSQNGVLISETAVLGTKTMTAGWVYAEVGGSVNTGLAFANPNNQPATISFNFTDVNGVDFGDGSMILEANGQMAEFLDQAPFNASAPLRATFTFHSSMPIAAVALRGFTNERSEFLMTTLPVANVNGPIQNQPVLLPQYADGGGWSTDIILVNPTDFPMSGMLQFSGPISVMANGDSVSPTSQFGLFNYSIPPRTSSRIQSAGAGDFAQMGWVQVTPTNYGTTPSGVTITPSAVAILSFKKSGVTVTQAGVPPVDAGTAFRMYVEASGDFNRAEIGSVQSGVAIANVTGSPTTVTFELFTLDGVSTGLSSSVDLVANQQKAVFLTQIPGFTALQTPIKGVLRISVPPGPGISIIGLRGRYNERGDFLIATTPPSNEGSAASSGGLVFPDIVDGGGYTTQFVLIGNAGGQTSGTMSFFRQDGRALNLGFGARGTPSSSVQISVEPRSATVQVGGTQQFTATVTGSNNKTVSWRVNGIIGGNSAIGTISASGLYASPTSIPNPLTVTIVATSTADPTKSAAASVTIQGSSTCSPLTPEGARSVNLGISQCP
jgi:hypothetical protein